jgi:hypothetical protein
MRTSTEEADIIGVQSVHPSPPDQNEMAFAPGSNDRSADDMIENTGYFTILKEILGGIKNPAG